MELFGIEAKESAKPALEEHFTPILNWNKAYLSKAREAFTVAITGDNDRCVIYRTKVRNEKGTQDADQFYVSHLVKNLLWIYGGYKVSIVGSNSLFKFLKKEFSKKGNRFYDAQRMSKIYDEEFMVELLASPPTAVETLKFMGRHLNGHRIGFDVSNTERKVVAVSNGKVVYSEEVLWHPTEATDSSYHFHGIKDGLMAAAKKLPRIDAIGISSAGIHVDNQVRSGSLYAALDEDDFEDNIADLFVRATGTMKCEHVEVVNHGDVSALAGAMSLNANNVLSISLGPSESTGFVDAKGNVTGWLNELSFVQIDLNPDSVVDALSGCTGCGMDYFSSRAVLRYAEEAGMKFDTSLTQPEKLKALLIKAEQDDKKARLAFTTVGQILGHTLAYYHSIYHFEYVLLQGPVMTGAGSDMIFNACQKILVSEHPEIASGIVLSVPEENANRVLPSVAAASLAEC